MTQSPPAVPKPAAAGTPQTAIANTKQAYANLRNGPGTRYRDIGDVRAFSLVTIYPTTRTPDGWMWLEQYGGAGWISTSVVTFEPTAVRPPIPAANTTPYDGKIGVWHWRGDSIPENTIDELALSLKQKAPNVKQVFVKTSDYTRTAGAQWQGYWDTKRALAIDGAASIDTWVTTLNRHGLEFHAWCVPRGLDTDAEANLIIQACKRPGVRSMILDVEPYTEFWQGGAAGVRPLMTKIRRAVPGSFHIGLCVDPRSHHYETIAPREWQPFVNSIHPMVYWVTMKRSIDELLSETFQVWGGFGKPIIPALQGDADAASITAAQTLSVQRHAARGVSWWRLGVIGTVQWTAINRPIDGTPPTQPPTGGTPITVYTDDTLVKPGDGGYTTFSHTGREELALFDTIWGWKTRYKATETQASKATVRWSIPIPVSGDYEISAFIPARHATARNARYKVHGVRNSTGELTVAIDQTRFRNQWATLGVFPLERNAANAGIVYLNDLTGDSGQSIAFDAMRWRRVQTVPLPAVGQPVPAGFADGYDSPVGTDADRRTAKVWPGQWVDASPFGRLYFVGTPSEAYHTGADLNLPRDADAHSPVYASTSGVVMFANKLPTWGNVIIIRHDPAVVTGQVLYGRYAHVETMSVEVGQRVTRGQAIAKVGNAFGRWAYHLHFDLSPTTILESNPEHWPGKNRDECFRNYIDPRELIEGARPR